MVISHSSSFIGKDFHKEHPHHLGDALRVAVHAGVFAHDVADGFEDAGDIAHDVTLLDLLRGGLSRGQKGPFSPTLCLFSVI